MKTLANKIPLMGYWRLLEKYLKSQSMTLLWLALIMFISISMQLINPQILRHFIDAAQQMNTAEQNLIHLALLFIFLSIVQQIFSVLSNYMGENVGWTATNKLRRDVAMHCLKLDMTFHKSHTAGSIIERVDGDVSVLSNFFSNFFISLFSNCLLMLGIIAFLFRENWLIGASMLFVIIVSFVLIQRIRNFSAPFWSKLRQISADFYGFLGENLDGTEDTRANGATGYVMSNFYVLMRRWLSTRTKAFLSFGTIWVTTIFVFTIGNAFAFGVCAYLWNQGSISMGTVFMVVFYTELLLKPIEKIRAQLDDLQIADASIRRVHELMDLKSKIEEGEGVPLPNGPMSVTFDQVTFGYEPNQKALHQINVKLERGKVLGVVGRTGSGKSTFARMLLRFYDPSSGSIQLEGIDLRETTIHELRSHVGYVTQNVEIIEGTLRENITFYDETIPDHTIIHVLRELGLESWLSSLPNGLNTMLQSDGASLSAGEAQLIAFARVFMKNPGLIIMDEASSQLDPATEQLTEQAISKLLENRTCIIIAHRLATLQRADEIVVLENGHVIEYGAREALASNPNSRFISHGVEGMLG